MSSTGGVENDLWNFVGFIDLGGFGIYGLTRLRG
jgi:hypothetical protein